MSDILDNIQIDEAFTNPVTGTISKKYGGCFLSDEIEKMTPQQGKVYIVNLDSMKNHDPNDDDIGSHWVGIANLLPTIIVYFDSFGLPPNESTKTFLKKARRKDGKRKRIIYSTLQVQNIDSTACGYFAIYVLKQLINRRSLMDTLLDDFNLFNTWKNNYLTKRIWKRQVLDEYKD